MKQRIKKLTACFLAFLMILTCSYTDVSAAASDYVYVEGTYMQTECRNMLNTINEFRQDSNQAWAWDESDSKKVYYSGLKPLQYDYTLEEMAMQRAAEIAVAYNHTRPTGDICFSIYNEYGYSYMGAGENIAAGYSSASDVFEGWKEENEPYEGQGHRRNMLDSDYTHIGIAGVKVGGTKYWVQVLAQPGGTPNTTKTSACDTTKKVKVAVDTSALTTTVTTTPTSLSLKVGEKADLPSVTVKVKHADSWPSSGCNVTTDYSWSYSGSGASISGNQLSGTAEGTGNLKTTILGKAVSVPVTVKDGEPISGCTITLGTTSYVYDGNAKTPSVTVKNGSTTLKKDTDYTVEYKNNTNAGTATAVITGTGNYTGSVEKTFTIAKAKQTITPDVTEIELAKGNTKQISVTGAKGALSYSSNKESVATVDSNGTITAKDSGSATITISAAATDNYQAGSATVAVTVGKVSISGCSVTLEKDSYVYDGSAKTPAVTVKNGDTALVKDTDYTVSYKNNTNVGTASVTITGTGNYKDSISKNFTITKAEQNITVDQTAVNLERGDTKQISVSGAKGTLSYKSSKTAVASVSSSGVITAKGPGTAVITITAAATEDYNAATAEVTVQVASVDLKDCEITLAKTQYTYNGDEKSPKVTVKDGDLTLEEGTDYTVAYKNNINAGTATVTISGSGNYTGSVEKTFTIVKAAQTLTVAKKELHLEKQESATISISGNQGALSFSSSNPQVAEVTADGVVTGKNSGDAVITVTAAETENYKQTTMSISVFVEKLPFDQAEIALSETEYTYTGEELEPSVTVSYDGKALVENKDYAVTYSDNINAGTAVVAVSGMGEYGGTVEKTFTINKAANKITASSQKKVYSTSKRTFSLNAKRLGSAKLTYKSSNAKITVSSTGKVTVPAKFIGKATITITAASTKNYNKAEKKVTFTVNPTGTSIKALSNPSKKKMKITWKKNSVGTGYQIMYATNSGFTKNKTTKLISKNGTLAATYSVTKGKTYYVKIRTYKTVNGVKYYSSWSAVKKIKIKK